MRALASRLPLRVFDGPRRAFDNLTDREQRLIVALLGVAGIMFAILPIWLLMSETSELADTNDRIEALLSELDTKADTLRESQTLRAALEERYRRQAPALGSFLDGLAKRNGLSLQEIVNQPEKVIEGYRRKHVRVKLPGVPLKPVIDLMTSIENSGYALALIELNIEHFREGDSYNVEFDLVSYAPASAEASN